MAGKKNFNTNNNNPNFKKSNPNEILASGHKDPDQPKNDTPTVIEPATHLEPQQNKNNDKKGQKYLRLDITNYQNYISLMAEHLTNTSGKYVSMTQYILRLIEADKQHNIELYEKLEHIEGMKRELI
ncbi:MAG: hypothetical protein HDT28_07630 [Clostridiales bacterium]|nr:hypothetical protein [Clostridiales bacterium]